MHTAAPDRERRFAEAIWKPAIPVRRVKNQIVFHKHVHYLTFCFKFARHSLHLFPQPCPIIFTIENYPIFNLPKLRFL